MIADIATDADRLHAIIENLLHLTRLGSGTEPDLEPQVLVRVLERSVASFRSRHRDRSIEVVGTPPVIVDADETYLGLLLENLLANAVKYSPPDTLIEVRLTELDGDEIEVAVLDRGIGIDADAGDRLFEPFYRTETARGAATGLGIGLALCQRIVTALGGRISAMPRAGGGAEVAFVLPIAGEDDDLR